MRPRKIFTKCLGTLFMSPNEKEPIQKKFKHKHGQNFHHILKFHTRPNSNVKVVECCKKEMFHSNFHFHFAIINISFKDPCILMSNNRMKEITHHTIDVEN